MNKNNTREGNNPRSPLARCKALHASLNCGIDEVFLNRAGRILLGYDEREQSVHSLQDLYQMLWVFVVCLNPGYPRDGLISRNILESSIRLKIQ